MTRQDELPMTPIAGAIVNLLIIAVQIGVAFVSLVCIYLLFVLLGYEGGFDRLAGVVLIQPVMAAAAAGLTVALCFIVGLPIRLIRPLNGWWRGHFWLALLLAIVGLGLLALANAPMFLDRVTVTEGDVEIVRGTPDAALVLAGWFVTAFAILHLYPPAGLVGRRRRAP